MLEICEKHFPDELKRLQTIPGIKERAATSLIAEIGTDMSKFERACRQTAVFVTGGNGVRFVQHREVLRNDALVEIGLNRILLHHLRGAR